MQSEDIEFNKTVNHVNWTKWHCICDCGEPVTVTRKFLTDKRYPNKTCGHSKFTKFGDMALDMLKRAEKRAITINVPFNITPEYMWNLFLDQNKKCAISGFDIVFKLKTKDINETASIDRIDSNKGYEIGNVQWVHKIVNMIKLDLSVNSLYYIVKSIYENKNLGNKQYSPLIFTDRKLANLGGFGGRLFFEAKEI